MRILAVVPSLARGGAERTVSRLSRAWAEDHEVAVAVFNAAGRAYPHGGELIDLRAPASRGRGFGPLFTGILRVARLHRLIRRTRPDLLVGFMESANIPLILAALASGSCHKVTLSIRGNPDRMRWFHRLLARGLYPFAARVVTVSEGVRRRFAALAPRAAPRSRVIYSPLDLDEIAALSAADPGSGSLDAPYFFSAGRLDEGKAFDDMIRLFAAASRPGMRLLIAGDGPERARLEALIDRSGLADRVRLLGAVENPFPFMRGARAFLLTSKHEGFPVVLIEAMACGCPFVSFDCDFGPREATRDGEAGFLVAVGDEARFTQRLSRLAADPALRERMSRAARARAADFAIRETAARWLERP